MTGTLSHKDLQRKKSEISFYLSPEDAHLYTGNFCNRDDLRTNTKLRDTKRMYDLRKRGIKKFITLI